MYILTLRTSDALVGEENYYHKFINAPTLEDAVSIGHQFADAWSLLNDPNREPRMWYVDSILNMRDTRETWFHPPHADFIHEINDEQELNMKLDFSYWTYLHNDNYSIPSGKHRDYVDSQPGEIVNIIKNDKMNVFIKKRDVRIAKNGDFDTSSPVVVVRWRSLGKLDKTGKNLYDWTFDQYVVRGVTEKELYKCVRDQVNKMIGDILTIGMSETAKYSIKPKK